MANLHKATPFPAMLDLVRRYHGLIPMGIGTGSPRINAEAVLRNTGLERYFPVVVTADDVALHKPHPDTFLLVAQRLGVAPEGCLVFEDTGIGAQAGEAAGMQVCMVKEGKPVGLTY
ncbi:Fructose-1-phosphate phosphatase YqaB [compost metagenome]